MSLKRMKWYEKDGSDKTIRKYKGIPLYPIKKRGKLGRNELCPCRSGKKVKRCHTWMATEGIKSAGQQNLSNVPLMFVDNAKPDGYNMTGGSVPEESNLNQVVTIPESSGSGVPPDPALRDT